MFASLGRFTYRFRWIVLVAGLLFMLAGGLLGTGVFPSLKSGGFYDEAAESTRVLASLHEDLGRDEGSLIVLFTSEDGAKVDSLAFKQGVEETLAKIGGHAGVGHITTYYTTGAKQLVSNDGLSTYAVVGLSGSDSEQMDLSKELRPLLTSDSLQVRLGGVPAISEEITEQVQRDLEQAETLTFPIIAVLLVLIFGSIIASVLPLAIGGMVILGSFLVLRGITNFTNVSIYAINVITMLGLGLAIDYSLFIVSRFREELPKHNGNVEAALVKTMQTAGRTVLFSGLTVMISLLSLLVFPQMFLQSMGLGGASAVLVAMLAAVTLLPAMLALLGHRVNSLSIWSLLRRNRNGVTARTAEEGRSGFWYSLSRTVMRRPGTVLVATLVPLVLVGLPFLHVTFSTPDARSLPAGSESRQVSEVLEADFARNETSPIQIVVRNAQPALDPASLSGLYDYTRQLAALPGVERVESLVNIDAGLDKAAYQAFYSDAGMAANPMSQAAAGQFSKGSYSLVSVIYNDEPHAASTQQLVKDIRSLQAPAGMSTQVGGQTAQLVDFLASLGNNLPWAFAIIVSVVFVLLFLMLGSVVVPLKAVVLNILSLSVSFGALVWVFQDGNLAGLLNFTPLGSIDGTQPILIFAIAFGLSMDYEVFLLSRIKESYDRTGDTTASVALGIQKTGAIITSAALLLAVVIGAFATGQVVFIKQIGVGLGLAVLVDATLVRGLLVPASMRLLGKYNWWAPAPLTRLYNRLGLSEVERHEAPAPVDDASAEAPVAQAQLAPATALAQDQAS
ncbi:MAG TPA: MMPL family transporter [Chloroflexia bacterium]